MIVGGDFNYSRLLDDLYGERGNHEFFDRIRDEGFMSFHRLFHETDEQTFFKKGGMEHQLDYLYGDTPVVAHVESCEVVPYAQIEELSDHTPLFADLGSEPLQRTKT
ncbi:MAG: hypothetical protein OEZ52_14160 [Candidatus Aminicenantes bacterium]|nr:hypothetical protein [Candidatus Aminicenantes bacterium]MDH5744685.1 hypothetical protein [Candidatus Aminicenantes bacterium]